jgi:hypothetical protein
MSPKSYLIKKPPCFEEINRKYLKYEETWWALGRGGFLVLLAGNPEGNAPIGAPLCLGISQSVSATLQALLKRSPILLGHFPKSRQYPLGSAQMVSKSS